jgi:uncharacterized protein YjiS (DUF1127 family)
MAYMDLRVGVRKSETPSHKPGSTFASNIAAAFNTWWRGRMRRRILEGLTPEQLRDIGQLENTRYRFEIKAGLMTNLMSMR